MNGSPLFTRQMCNDAINLCKLSSVRVLLNESGLEDAKLTIYNHRFTKGEEFYHAHEPYAVINLV